MRGPTVKGGGAGGEQSAESGDQSTTKASLKRHECKVGFECFRF